jgi:hypothetical protein
MEREHTVITEFDFKLELRVWPGVACETTVQIWKTLDRFFDFRKENAEEN